MAKAPTDAKLAQELLEMLLPVFPGIEVEVGRNPRWPRRCLTFQWSGFEDLLPEERFYRLVRVIPEEYRAKQLSGCVWLELAPNESVDQFLKHPRSEDAGDREPQVFSKLLDCGFFAALASTLGANPDAACTGDFSKAVQLMAGKGLSREAIRDAKLVLIRNGAFCDCQVLKTAQPALAEMHAGAA